ncbi:tRNA (adenosine(37)-N6)-dimethylallyltransferase MiaA [Stenoxybacter acetivorans]|uniref:tRNA (adenosine(37)-N6)-dimethylallyltransferase MiaA n=1 Tax=Stenoxybacter acetivorans TaxID=422441 RepID=UPI00056823C0|nr:tRNA (adenosine(37)-N6)-dimethylallyltransferase MiaA [Stenoxybacter acetivorans]
MSAIPKILAILGPTASGKTGLALALAKTLPIEIISLDSALVYRGMDIGTAKPTAAELAQTPHHLINIISPLQSYSAAAFVSDCVHLAKDIHARGRLPLLVGGTMMYYHALTQGLNDLPAADEAVRRELAAEKRQYGLAHLYQRLQNIDAVTANRLEPTDSQRIERALEVWRLSGKPLSQHFAEQQAFRQPVDLCTVALIPENRPLLHQHIALRFQHMMQHGLADEVRRLQQNYPELTADMPSMRCVGYRQTWDYLAGVYDEKTWSEKGIAATRQLAKRQLTWLRRLSVDYVFDPYQENDLLSQVAHICRQYFQDA